MRKSHFFSAAAFIGATCSMAALAQPGYGPPGGPGQGGPGPWDRIGSVQIDSRPDREVAYTNFGGSVERLAFQANDGDVTCRNISVLFANGQSAVVFNGTLQRGRQTVVDIPGTARNIRQVAFNCRVNGPARQTDVDIAADVGRYRAEWRNGPNWERQWSRVFAWANDRDNNRGPDRGPDRGPGRPGPGNGPGGWMPIGSERFEGPRDQETTYAGARGQAIETVGIQAMDNDARCSRLTATFDNGRTTDLYVNRGGILNRGRMYEVDLPGNRRNLERLDMTCRGERGRPVTVQISAHR